MKKISEIEKNIDKYLNNDTYFGEFYSTELTEMARLGKIPQTKYEIHLQGGEGFIPHFHICKKSGQNVIMRICFLTNEYFRENDDKHNTLNAAERKALNEYLSEVIDDSSKVTRWQTFCWVWNQFNPNKKIENIANLKMPDYTIINEPKK